MKQLSNADIEQMIGTEYVPDARAVNRAVRAQLKLGTLIPDSDVPAPRCARVDLHNHTIEQAWDKIMNLATSGVRDAVIITGASGVLRQTFPQWAENSILTPFIVSYAPINNGSFSVKFKKQNNQK